MSAIEIIAVIVTISVLLKTVMFLVNPTPLKRWAEVMMGKACLMQGVMLAFIVIVGYFLLTNLTVVQVVASMVLGHFLMALLLLQYPKIYKKMIVEIFKEPRKMWLPFLIWIILAVWTLWVVFV